MKQKATLGEHGKNSQKPRIDIDELKTRCMTGHGPSSFQQIERQKESLASASQSKFL